MKAPGEQLILKLWETLTEKAIGGLLKPWQIRREGRAQIDVKRDELLILAAAEREADAIRHGKTILAAEALPAHVASSHKHLVLQPNTSTTTEGYATPIEIAKRAALGNALRHEVNVAKAVLHAEEALESSSAPPPERKIGDDWIYRWQNYAASVSTDDLQKLWGLVLAGETKAPGAFSLRFLNFLHTLDSKDAEIISIAMPFVVGDFISRDTDDLLAEAGLTFSRLLQLQELGVLSAVDGLGINKSFTMHSTGDGELRLLLISHNHGVGLTSIGDQRSLKLSAYPVTDLGRQLSTLGQFEANLSYLRAIGSKLKEQGFEVEIGRTEDLANGKIRLIEPELL